MAMYMESRYHTFKAFTIAFGGFNSGTDLPKGLLGLGNYSLVCNGFHRHSLAILLKSTCLIK